MKWESLFIGLVGALMGGGFSLWATKKSHDFTSKREIAREERIIISLQQAIYDEVETLWESYMKGMGVQIEALQENQPMLAIYPVTQEYFTVYAGNSFLIGRIDDHDLRRSIISSYTKAKALLDSYRMNNELVGKYENFNFLYRQTGQATYLTFQNFYLEGLVKYAKVLKDYHKDVKGEMATLLRMLRKKGVLVEEKN